jgi:hypothetical protein
MTGNHISDEKSMAQSIRFKEDAARFYASNILLALHHLHS